MIDDSFGYWLSGFIDGEGCFAILQKGRFGSYICSFHITLRRDDEAILRNIVDATQCGQVYRMSATPDAARPNAKPTSRWTVEKRAEVLSLIRILDRYPLRAKKARDYAIWRESAFVWKASRPLGRGSDRHKNAEIWKQMGRFKHLLEAERRFDSGQNDEEIIVCSDQLMLGISA